MAQNEITEYKEVRIQTITGQLMIARKWTNLCIRGKVRGVTLTKVTIVTCYLLLGTKVTLELIGEAGTLFLHNVKFFSLSL